MAIFLPEVIAGAAKGKRVGMDGMSKRSLPASHLAASFWGWLRFADHPQDGHDELAS
jgi:hypothetical protein